MAVPRTIHQMWIGPNRPDEWMGTWRIPGWNYELWDYDRVLALSEEFGFEPRRPFGYFWCKAYWPGVKDSIIPTVLHRYGGVFVDADCVRLRPWDSAPFMESAGFAGRTEPHPGQPDRLSVSIVGAEPGSVVMADWRTRLENLTEFEPEWDTMIPPLAEAAATDPDFLKLPQGTFYPVGLRGHRDDTVEPYAEHYWGTTRNLYARRSAR